MAPAAVPRNATPRLTLTPSSATMRGVETNLRLVLVALAPLLMIACGSSDSSSPGAGGGGLSAAAGASGIASPGTGGTASVGSGGADAAGAPGSTGGAGGSTEVADSGIVIPADAGVPDLDPNANVEDLTDAQKGELCDWMMAISGGYGLTVLCSGGGEVTNPATQAACISGSLYFRCPPVTVGEVEICYIAQAPTNGCVYLPDQCHWLFCK